MFGTEGRISAEEEFVRFDGRGRGLVSGDADMSYRQQYDIALF